MTASQIRRPRSTRMPHRFSGRYERRVLPGVGHNMPQEAPEATLAALRDLLRG